LNVSTGRVLQIIPVGHVPRGLSLSPDGRRLFVTNSWDDTVTVIDTNTASVIATWPAGYEPSSVVEDRAGKRLFVADRIGNNITVLDAATGAEQETLEAGRGASYLAMTADGSRLYATHVYPNPTPHRTPPKSEITVIDPQRAQVVDRISLPYIAGMFHVALSRDGRLGVVGQLHPKNLVPLAHVEHGWAFVDTLTVFGADVGKRLQRISHGSMSATAAQITCRSSMCGACSRISTRIPSRLPKTCRRARTMSSRGFPWVRIRGESC
jgi:YVTN family beta-propeller protein